MELKNLSSMERIYQHGIAISQGKTSRTFDWQKAKRLIKELGLTDAAIGYAECWCEFSSIVLNNGKRIYDSRLNSCSVWATPVLVFLDCNDKKVVIDISIPCSPQRRSCTPELWIYEEVEAEEQEDEG